MITVGKPRLKIAIFLNLIFIIWAVVLFRYSPYPGIKSFSILLILLCILVIIPNTAYSSIFWYVDQEAIYYTNYDNLFQKTILFYRQYLKRTKMNYQIKVNLKMISYIEITYVPLPKPFFWNIGYDIIFIIKTKDNSEYIFKALCGRQRKAFNQAVAYLQKIGIRFKDKYQIINQLKNSPEHISYYLDQIEKEKQL
ncbi:hypothetical protein [uncultured Thomasclavelia sp.]|uniref:hypothetical protein n=1 Tax=uncultured Thomasclavelia sp. TaxID=3025759 RepID=UPI0025E03046|nr:hypothetical protein [uncultured Thomasclavelia sp.]